MIGLDLGARRIGVAVSDDDQRVAAGYGVIERAGEQAADHRAISRLVTELDAVAVVIGLPLSLSGAIGPAARTALAEADVLSEMLPVPVATHDERFTTVAAAEGLRAGGARGRARRKRIDETAAAIMLQSWLDAGSPLHTPARP